MKNVIMIVTNRYDPDIRVHKEAVYLTNKGYSVEVLCWDREREFFNKKEEVRDGVKIKRFYPYSKYGSGIKQIKGYFYFLREIKKYLKNKNYEYLHCHDLDGIFLGYFARKNNAKLIFDMHEYYEMNKNQNKIIKMIIRFIVFIFQTLSDWVIYVNSEQVKKVNKNNIKKLVYLPNYPDISYFKNTNKKISEKLRVSYIGSVRQYIELKNLMDACKKLPEIEININGTGVALEKIKQIKDNYNNVNISGRFDVLEINELYNNSDLSYIIYPNTIQYKLSYPVKFFESILTLTPVVVGKGTVLEKMVKEKGIGYIVDGQNIDSIKDVLSKVNKKSKKYNDIVDNLKKIQFYYTWKNIVNNLEKIYIF